VVDEGKSADAGGRKANYNPPTKKQEKRKTHAQETLGRKRALLSMALRKKPRTNVQKVRKKKDRKKGGSKERRQSLLLKRENKGEKKKGKMTLENRPIQEKGKAAVRRKGRK